MAAPHWRVRSTDSPAPTAGWYRLSAIPSFNGLDRKPNRARGGMRGLPARLTRLRQRARRPERLRAKHRTTGSGHQTKRQGTQPAASGVPGEMRVFDKSEGASKPWYSQDARLSLALAETPRPKPRRSELRRTGLFQWVNSTETAVRAGSGRAPVSSMRPKIILPLAVCRTEVTVISTERPMTRRA